ncbi:uncharacterized protein swt1 isoform X2 [Genypterus blacodes]|uniref:uncharacterized protein swt1 isoform X2 n=1 Tax=Genypterus blacodes TaxID=154954 RepID=UPI003F763B50
MSTKPKKRKRKKLSSSSSEEEAKKASKDDVTKKHRSSETRHHSSSSSSHDRKMSERSKERRSKTLRSSSSEEEDERASKRDVTKKHTSAERRQHSSRHHRTKSPEIRKRSPRRSSRKSPSREEEDEKASKDGTRNCTSAERRQHSSRHEGCTTKPEKEGICASCSSKDVSQSSRPMREAHYSRDRREAEQKPVSKPVSVFAPKEKKPDVSEKYTIVRVPVLVGRSISILKSLEKKKLLEQQKQNLKDKESQCTGAKTSSSTSIQRPPTSDKHTTSDCDSELSTTKPGSVTSDTPAKSAHTSKKPCPLTAARPLSFKIPKKATLQPLGGFGHRGVSANRSCTRETVKTPKPVQLPKPVQRPEPPEPPEPPELPKPVVSGNNTKQETARPFRSHASSTPQVQCEGQDKSSSLSGQQPTQCSTNTVHRDDQKQVVEELQLARFEKTLEMDVMQSYGELTSMVIDPPEEGNTSTQCKQSLQQELILILDTNILLSHLDYVKKIQTHGLGALGFPVLLIPWVVLQELDYLKMGKSLSGSVAHLASPAISYIYNCLTRQEPRLWGQSMQQAAHSSNGLHAESNDDRVLQCCLQYQGLYPECALILCTNDKNLCSKALLSGVKASSKTDLERESVSSSNGVLASQCIQTSMLLHANAQAPAPIMSQSCTPRTQSQRQSTSNVTHLPVGPIQNDSVWPSKGTPEEEQQRSRELSTCVSELEVCLREALSDVLEVEMKAAYDELWLEIVYIKPPWTLVDILQCLKKHWIAVFGFVAPRTSQQTVSNLIDFFKSEQPMPYRLDIVSPVTPDSLLLLSRCPSGTFLNLQPRGNIWNIKFAIPALNEASNVVHFCTVKLSCGLRALY